MHHIFTWLSVTLGDIWESLSRFKSGIYKKISASILLIELHSGDLECLFKMLVEVHVCITVKQAWVCGLTGNHVVLTRRLTDFSACKHELSSAACSACCLVFVSGLHGALSAKSGRWSTDSVHGAVCKQCLWVTELRVCLLAGLADASTGRCVRCFPAPSRHAPLRSSSTIMTCCHLAARPQLCAWCKPI